MKGSKTTLDRIKLLNSVDKIYCVSNYIKERFLTGIISEKYKVVVLHNGDVAFGNLPRDARVFGVRDGEFGGVFGGVDEAQQALYRPDKVGCYK